MKRDLLLSVVTVIEDSAVLDTFLKNVLPVIAKITNAYEIVIVGNGLTSDDIHAAKSEIPKYPRIRLLLLAGLYSTDVAFTAGIESSIGDYLIIMDPVSDPVDLIPQMLEAAEAGTDIVIASNGLKRYRSPFRRFAAFLYFRLISSLLLRSEDVDPSYFTCISRKTLTGLAQFKDTVRNYRFLRSMLGFSRHTIAYEPKTVSQPIRRHRLLTQIVLGLESFFSYSLAPLRVFSSLAFLLGALNYSYVVYAIVAGLFKPGIASGWASTSAIYGFMFGSMSFLMGIYGWYLSLLLKEVKKVPLYQVSEEIDTGSPFAGLKTKNVV